MNGSFLRDVLTGESRAYGFTIAFWGSGQALAYHATSIAPANVFSYGLGAVTGFSIMAFFAFREALQPAKYEKSEYMVMSMMHYLAALLPIALAYLYGNYMSGNALFFATGASVSLTYNIAMVLEELFSEEAREIESNLMQRL
ncbi:MAG: cation transport ATPase [Colwellia polaris]|jgi:cation transport ATPase